MKANAHFTFEGQAETALNFYASALHGQIVHIMRAKDACAAEMPGRETLTAEQQELIVYAELNFGGNRIGFCDQMPGVKLTRGDNVLMDVETETGEEARRIYNALAEGGEQIFPMAATFWTENYGMVRDRFGIVWNIMQAAK